MIPNKHIKPGLALSLGTQIHINHPDCSAGIDTKKRLYIKRVVGGVVAYCHHCNEAGFVRELSTDGTVLRKWLHGSTPDLPLHGSGLRTWPYIDTITNTEILLWLNKYDISPTMTTTNPFGEVGGLYMVLKNFMGSNYGYQIRNFKKDTSKYTTYIVNPCGEDVSWFKTSAFMSSLVITEDYVSAYRVNRDVGCNSVALLKTTISPSTITNIQKLEPQRVIVWLDPDEAGKRGAIKVAQRLSYVLKDTVVSTMNCNEPKTYSSLELRKLCG